MYRSGRVTMTETPNSRVLHVVKCWRCKKEFELVGATWCGCGAHVERPSKVCPHCLQCACSHPDYGNEALWGTPPPFLKHHGFDKLFYLYL
jgi:hypothetical protein